MKKNNLSKSLVMLRRWKTLLTLTFIFSVTIAFSQTRQISGVVVAEEDGLSLIGANVLIKGTSTGTITDFDGKFTLDAAPTDVLVFSYTGFVTQEITIGNQTFFEISLAVSANLLEEAVVIGYGTQKKSLVTGSISQLKGEAIQNLPVYRAEQAIQGRTAGVSVLPNSGSPGSGLKVRIRGTGTNGNSEPLYIVDGMRTGDIAYLEPGDIESIEILKDAASAAIYGAEGANGVVLITTKSGEAGQTQISVNSQFGWQNAANLPPVMNSAQYAEYLNEAGVGVTIPTNSSISTNWLEEITETAPMQRHHLSFSGGNAKSTYLVSGSYFDQNGVVGGEKANYNRATARFNSRHEIREWLEVGSNISYAHFNRSAIAEDDEFGGIISSGLMFDPLTPVTFDGTPEIVQNALNDGKTVLQDENGKYYGLSEYVSGEIVNPVAKIALAKGQTEQDKLLGNFFATLKPIQGLSITSRIGIDYATQNYHTWNPTFFFSSENQNTNPTTRDNWDNWSTWLWENYASYNRTVGNHNFTVLGGVSAQRFEHKWLGTLSGPMFKEQESFAQHGVVEIDGKLNGNLEVKTLASYFGRVSYDYRNKYLLEAAFRRDGSSLLAPGNKWANFPSVSVGWVLSEEAFWPSAVVDYFKLRGSWGQNGSLSNLGYDQFSSLITTAGIKYPKPGGGFYTGAEPELLANPELRWETSEQTDIGFDLTAFDGKLLLGVDYYKKITKDLLTPSSPPLSVGNSAPFVNAGDVTNTGFEFELGYRKRSGAFNYNVNLNFTTIKNEVTYLNPLLDRVNGAGVGTGWTATFFEEGYPVWFFRGYETNGIFQNQGEIEKYIADNGLTGYTPAPGDPIVVNTNGDELINEDDMTYIGDPHPDFLFGAVLNANYKGFDVNVFLQGSVGNDILLGWNRVDRITSNRPLFFYEDRWTGEGSTNDWFRADMSSPIAYRSDFMIFDGTYMRIKQVQLGYTLPDNLMSKLSVSKARIYISLDDYFTFTKYPGFDPEAGSGNNQSQGIDRGIYPIPRKMMTGINVTF